LAFVSGSDCEYDRGGAFVVRTGSRTLVWHQVDFLGAPIVLGMCAFFFRIVRLTIGLERIVKRT